MTELAAKLRDPTVQLDTLTHREKALLGDWVTRYNHRDPYGLDPLLSAKAKSLSAPSATDAAGAPALPGALNKVMQRLAATQARENAAASEADSDEATLSLFAPKKHDGQAADREELRKFAENWAGHLSVEDAYALSTSRLALTRSCEDALRRHIHHFSPAEAARYAALVGAPQYPGEERLRILANMVLRERGRLDLAQLSDDDIALLVLFSPPPESAGSFGNNMAGHSLYDQMYPGITTEKPDFFGVIPRGPGFESVRTALRLEADKRSDIANKVAAARNRVMAWVDHLSADGKRRLLLLPPLFLQHPLIDKATDGGEPLPGDLTGYQEERAKYFFADSLDDTLDSMPAYRLLRDLIALNRTTTPVKEDYKTFIVSANEAENAGHRSLDAILRAYQVRRKLLGSMLHVDFPPDLGVSLELESDESTVIAGMRTENSTLEINCRFVTEAFFGALTMMRQTNPDLPPEDNRRGMIAYFSDLLDTPPDDAMPEITRLGWLLQLNAKFTGCTSFLFAHELGHHALHHPGGKQPPAEAKEREFQADEFASVLVASVYTEFVHRVTKQQNNMMADARAKQRAALAAAQAQLSAEDFKALQESTERTMAQYDKLAADNPGGVHDYVTVEFNDFLGPEAMYVHVGPSIERQNAKEQEDPLAPADHPPLDVRLQRVRQTAEKVMFGTPDETN